MSMREMNCAKKVTKKISDCATKFEQNEEDKNIFEDEIDELQKLAADNMALAELAAKWAAKARRETMQQKEVVAELSRNTMSDIAESQQQSQSPEASRDPSLADPHTPRQTGQVITNIQEVGNEMEKSGIEEDDDDNEKEMGYTLSSSEENELEFEDESPAAAKKPATAAARKPSAVQNVNDEGSSANDSEPLAQFAKKKGSKPQQGESTKKKKTKDLHQKPKHFGQPPPKIIARKPATSKKKNEKQNETRGTHQKHALEAEIATQAKSTTSPVTRSDTSNKRQKGGK